MKEPAISTPPEAFGRYLLYPAIARGGMATVHTARLVGAEGFTRLVAAKRLHPQFTDDPDFVTMFHDEACIASRIHHPNVVPVLDVVLAEGELILVQEYVHGVPLSYLMKEAQADGAPVPIDTAIAVLTGVLAGLHAAHEVRDDQDRSLEIVHRDVSPQNVMVSVDGIPRLLDFGIAKATTSTHHTREGVFKGKLAYMAPEQLRMEAIDRTTDVYATGVLAWELLVNRRIYDGRHEVAFVHAVLSGAMPKLLEALAETRASIDDARWSQLAALEPIVACAMAPERGDRFATAAEMLVALLEVQPAATSMVVSEWVRARGADYLDQRQRTLAANEESWRRTSIYAAAPRSGTHPVGAGSVLLLDTPGDLSILPGGGRSSAPPSVSSPSAAPHTGTSNHRAALGLSPPRLRESRVVPWLLTAAAFLIAGIVGGLLRGAVAPAPVMASAPEGNELIAIGSGSSLAPLPAAAPSVLEQAAPTASTQTVIHPLHVAPPPPRAVWVPRPASPPSAAPSTTATPTPTPTPSAAKADCNPPFYFEGPKKIFKPSCL